MAYVVADIIEAIISQKHSVRAPVLSLLHTRWNSLFSDEGSAALVPLHQIQYHKCGQKAEYNISSPNLKMAETLKLQLQFGGGAELLFDKIKKREIELPSLKKYFPDSVDKKWTIKELLVWIKDNLLRERPELFLQGDSVRPGILVLINDADWELFGELEYEIQENDIIMFISTLHGG